MPGSMNFVRYQLRISRRSSQSRKARAIRQAHMERAAPLITEALANYDLTNLQAGPAERAHQRQARSGVSRRQGSEPHSDDRDHLLGRSRPEERRARAWQQRVKDTFDYAALAALVK
jgi:hypothetical protein